MLKASLAFEQVSFELALIPTLEAVREFLRLLMLVEKLEENSEFDAALMTRKPRHPPA